MLFNDLYIRLNTKVMGHNSFGDSAENSMSDLSPVSAQRLNFDRLPIETTDTVNETKNVFGVPMPQFVPQRVLSWLDNTSSNVGNANNQSDTESVGSDRSSSNNNGQCTNVTRKVRPVIAMFLHIWELYSQFTVEL